MEAQLKYVKQKQKRKINAQKYILFTYTELGKTELQSGHINFLLVKQDHVTDLYCSAKPKMSTWVGQ